MILHEQSGGLDNQDNEQDNEEVRTGMGADGAEGMKEMQDRGGDYRSRREDQCSMGNARCCGKVRWCGHNFTAMGYTCKITANLP